MSDKIKIPEEVISAPYEDHEHPSIRFEITENEEVTKHLLFYKTDKKKSFSEGHEPSDILFDMFKEIQTLPKITGKDNDENYEIFNKFLTFVTPFLPHLLIETNSKSNVIKVDENKKDISLNNIHKAFKVASKGKRQSMIHEKE